MAKQYGLKEVADVYFVEINNENKADLFTGDKMNTITAAVNTAGDALEFTIGSKKVLDPDSSDTTGIKAAFKFNSLKTSNIEVASEETTAKGGKGNPELISWSYGKTATLTITDALLTPETLALMYGGKKSGTTITIDGKTFPNNYIILGTTLLRPLEGGDDQPFGFVLPKGKVNVGGTLTMEAEGDPSTFEMSIKALAQDFSGADDVLLQFIVPSGN